MTTITTSASFAFQDENIVKNGATIQGKVIDTSPKNTPLEGVKVTVIAVKDGKTWTTLTDDKGEYKITGLPAGRYTVSVSKQGYANRVGKSKVVAAGGEIYDRIKMRKLRSDAQAKIVGGALQHIAESIGKRYELDTPTVQELTKSIQDANEVILQQRNTDMKYSAEVKQYAKLGFLVAMLTHPDTKASFAKHLTDTQLQDYTDLILERRRKLRQAIIHVITAYLDQELSLTMIQRQKILQVLLDIIGNQTELPIFIILNDPMQRGVVNFINNVLQLSLNSILSQTQSKIWSEIITQQVQPTTLPKGRIESNEPNNNKEDITKSSKWIRAEATLKAHTQLLGELNETESERLEVVSKGVIQQYMEFKKQDIGDYNQYISGITMLMGEYMMGKITQDLARIKLIVLKRDVLDNAEKHKKWDGSQPSNIIAHPLYQQAIKDVLSEDAYLRYEKIQKDRENFRLQATRDFTLSLFDMNVLVNEPQWKQLSKVVQQINNLALSAEGMQMMLLELFIMIDKDILTPWQLNVFKTGR